MDKFVQRGADGSVDVDASALAYAEALTEWCAKNEIPADQIAGAVNSVLEAHSTRVPVPALLSAASHALGANGDTFKVLSTRIHDYIKGQVKAGALFVVKGKGGGVTRQDPKAAKSA